MQVSRCDQGNVRGYANTMHYGGFRKALARKQLKVRLSGVPFRGVRGGESERGRIGTGLEEGPLPFWAHFREKS